MTTEDMHEHYASADEGQRLHRSGHGRLELVRMRELFTRLLPTPPAQVLDVGGGTGIHASWLAAQGWSVHLVDPVEHHVEAAQRDGRFDAVLGDARALDADDDSVDAVLLLGPLYHLVEPTDRQSALCEALRVLRPGGVLMAAGISRFMALLDWGVRGELDAEVAAKLDPVIRTGRHDPTLGFTDVHFHLPGEMHQEVETAGFAEVQVLGIEGPLWLAVDAGDEDRLFEGAVRAARLTESAPELLAANPHFLAVARKAQRTV